MKVWLISDPHFYHARIIEYAQRPFHNLEQMHEYILEMWNKHVGKEDLVFVLGDWYFPTKADQAAGVFFSKFNGSKVLLKGNHDTKSNTHYMERCYFDGVITVFNVELVRSRVILSHMPLIPPEGWLNIHGHTHRQNLYTGRHLNVSVENLQYVPLEVKDPVFSDELIALYNKIRRR